MVRRNGDARKMTENQERKTNEVILEERDEQSKEENISTTQAIRHNLTVELVIAMSEHEILGKKEK